MPPIRVVNRFFEENPSNQADGVALPSRPPTTLLIELEGEGRPRSLFTQDGTFDGALFGVFGAQLFRINTTQVNGFYVIQPITGTIAGDGFPQMDGRGNELFLCDGTNFFYYLGNEIAALGTLTLSGNPSNNQTVTIGALTWTFKTALSSGPTVPFEVLIGASASDSLDNLIAAINGDAGEGTLYSTGTTPSPEVTAYMSSASVMIATAIWGGAGYAGNGGNNIATTETLSSGAWGAATLLGGVDGSLQTITMPDSQGVVSIAVLKQQVLAVASQSQKFYWVLPNEFTVDSLNFASADQRPDQLISVRVVGDYALMFGTQSTEVWYANPTPADTAENFLRQDGQAFSRGIFEGSDVVVDDSLIVVGDDNKVYQVDGAPVRVSTHYIEEMIRLARKAELEA